ncbi:acetyl-CoA carboxylase carboxyltransferase subunit alpha [Candidatus Liberibacter americanus]|uniref:Acetyl-coenzyme A carboxylase carboxyl transferase subunit alpha n=1 Tax=Candidatus Liberibacter americanus str. Sao Paulo TaxID=1261131 RepID=U6B8Z9_9HYPH|nr:acetyl-CoA carboxylase carboxyltransferase subunit alpha [Candidatus Liberibacter americanus]AHA28336.1 Acetyl-CoA carboxylase alpha subunit [Candidatus Liberibacter americanus str. Sao Paulo]EMS36626.1 acetyl-CoA carboxylase carboxyltransferase subunit alpha [Candidatus Liberibacter americanus PW_SP]
MHNYLDFEKPISDIEAKIHELKKISNGEEDCDNSKEITKLENMVHETLSEIYSKLDPWQKTQVSRHPNRPHFVDYVADIFTNFIPLSGDRLFGDDQAMQTGLAKFDGQSVAIIGQEKGSDTKSRIKHNFGSPRPEGYRKAVRIMQLADRFGLPVISFVDTAGAYPGIDAEERGQGEAIARCTEMCLNLRTPIIAVIIGEGGSGGAMGIAAADRVYMLENSIYSVISPEGASSILWKDPSRAPQAAAAMKITADDLKRFSVIDGIIPEPIGGAHRNHSKTIFSVRETIRMAISDLSKYCAEEIRQNRHQKYLSIGRSI